jgi:hypothetical protein
MPGTAALIDQMRSTLGTDVVNSRLRKAMKGEPGCFYARENGISFGTPNTNVVSVISWGSNGRSYRQDPEWMIEARVLATANGMTIPVCNPDDIVDIHREADALRKVYAFEKSTR